MERKVNCNLCVYISSICPWTHLHLLTRQYCLVHIKEKVSYKNKEIRPFKQDPKDLRTKGVFVYMVKEIVDDEKKFFEDASSYLRRFLNYLTLYSNHGFKDMDNYIYVAREIADTEIFHARKLPSIEAIAYTYEDRNISELIKSSLKKADDVRPLNSLSSKIDNALLLYRSSFFQESEGMRYILRFTALESLIENQNSTLNDDIIRKIMIAARKVCNEEEISPNDTDKIYNHIGQLTKESIKNMIKNTLKKYQITLRDREVEVDKLYDARNKFVHDGVEIKNLHQLSIDMEKIIPQLVNQLIASNSN